jgi:hypothetical protein
LTLTVEKGSTSTSSGKTLPQLKTARKISNPFVLVILENLKVINPTPVTEDNLTTNCESSSSPIYVKDLAQKSLTPNRGRSLTRSLTTNHGRSLTPVVPNQGRPSRPPTPIKDTSNQETSRTSTPSFPMAVDYDNYDQDFDDYDDRNNYYSSGEHVPLPRSHVNEDDRLTTKKFIYTMNLLDSKINSLYKLCRHISDQQQKNTLSIQKLSAVDELSKDFWNVNSLIYLATIFWS